MSNGCDSTQRFVGSKYVFTCMREEGHFGSHQSITKDYYENNVLAEALWTDSGARSEAIGKMYWNECDECGLLIDDVLSSCFTCDAWLKLLEVTKSGSLIVDGFYYVMDMKDISGTVDYDFELFDTSLTPVATNKVWQKGFIPAQLRERFPDNARWLDGVKPPSSHFANFSPLSYP